MFFVRSVLRKHESISVFKKASKVDQQRSLFQNEFRLSRTHQNLCLDRQAFLCRPHSFVQSSFILSYSAVVLTINNRLDSLCLINQTNFVFSHKERGIGILHYFLAPSR